MLLTPIALLATACGQSTVDTGRYQMSGDRVIDTQTGCVVERQLDMVKMEYRVNAYNPFNKDDATCAALSSPMPIDSRSEAEKEQADKEVQAAIDVLSKPTDRSTQ
ncbi:MAG: hypothetical protein B7X96_01025 [Novosphingobium sp. 17-62-8]|nr:MAG: hypothetical protein B7X96_01025 [Novosphingobium sp. 17-62-8]